MFEFECWHEDNVGDKWCCHRYIAETLGKAKRAHYDYLQDGLWEDDFFTVVRKMKCRKIGKAHISCLFGDKESFDSMKNIRNIEFAYQGMKVEVNKKPGIIIGAHGLNLSVCFESNTWGDNCHPWWETIYYDNNGNVVANYCESKAKSM